MCASITHVEVDASSRIDIEETKYGFFLHVFHEPTAVVHQAQDVRKYYPEAPVYISSDGGLNYTRLCAKIGNCKFVWNPPANDRWNPKPFLTLFSTGLKWLGTEYVIM